MTALHRRGIELLERLGGSDAAVHRAVVRETGRVVVAKHAGWDRPEVTARLGREAAVLRRVQHPSLVRLVDEVDAADGRYLLLAHAPGGSLADVVAAGDRPAPAEVAELGARLADALAALHGAGVVHGDVHPGNVLLDAELQPLLADLGSALDGTGPPLDGDEVVRHRADHERGVPRGAADDLHGLATTLWTLATGAPPGSADATPPTVLHAHPAVPGPLHAVLEACLTGTAGDAATVRTQLIEIAAMSPSAAPPSPTSPSEPALPGSHWPPHVRPATRDRTRPGLVATGTVVAVALAVLGGVAQTRSVPRTQPAVPPPRCHDTVTATSGGQQVEADLDGDGCAEVLTLHRGELDTPSGRFRFGLPGDILVAGDWDGDGRWGVGLYRPATGTVYLVDEPGPGATSGPAQEHVAGGTPAVVTDGRRHRVVIERG